ncbi:MFS transporter [Actinomadura flavalba]|uniref:MFS transporter n=1 Tax=Actinomadura flavalba TaxID=1120938 RepID=UPI000381951F|nr:MFS transporter [Actinomadura flavalba]
MYALLFADTGLGPAQISSLFVLWSATAFVFEVPSGVLADLVARRTLLTCAPLVTGAGYALWTFAPSYPAFAAGFVLWGAGSALRSGTVQALAYEELERAGAADTYARVIGRVRALDTTAVLVATALAVPVLAWGGYTAVGVASVGVCVLGALVARALPEGRPARADPDEDEPGFRVVLRDGLRQVRAVPGVGAALAVLSALTFVAALDEYLPLLAASMVPTLAAVPALLFVVAAGDAAGAWCAGRGTRWFVPLLGAAALFLAAGAASGHPAGMVLVGAAFGVFQWSLAAADARLQDRIEPGARATVTSLAGFGEEVVAVLAFAGYALGSRWAGPGALFAFAALPYAALALLLAMARRRGSRG